jgi:pimeloyl-ACP methyl ester carboxylesterase
LDDLATITNALNCGKFDVARPSSIGLLGHSRGGGMSLLLARQLGIVAAVVTWSAIGRARRHTDEQIAAWKRAGTIDIPHARLRIRLPLDYDVVEDCLANEDGLLNIPEAATSLRRPWLQVHGTADETVPFTEAEELASHGNQGHKFIAVDGAGHTYGTTHPWGGPTPELLSTLDRSLAFLAINLR